MVQLEVENDPVAKFNDQSEKITLVGYIIDEHDVRSSYQNLRIKIKETDSIILVSVNRHQTYHYLDEVTVTGKLTTPISEGDFNYRNYLMKDGIYSLMSFPEITLIPKNHEYNIFSFFYEKILFLKTKMEVSIISNYPPPERFIIEGIILGNDKHMSQELKDKFNAAGLSHVTAVSGSNIVIMTSIAIPMLLFCGLWRQKALYLTLVCIWVYVTLVGLPASAIRAAIMASLMLLSQIVGRQNTSSRTIIMAAALMVFLNPRIVFYDIGFQLSFLASMGIIHAKPIIDSALYSLIKKKEKISIFYKKYKIKILVDIFSTTLAAQLFTLPIMLYYFKSISSVVIITNLLILPIVTLLTFLGFWSTVLGVFSRFLGWVFYLPCQILLWYFIKILDIFYQPWTRFNISMSLSLCLIYYIILFVFILFMGRKIKPVFLEY